MKKEKQIFFISSIKNEHIKRKIEIDKSFKQYKFPLEDIDNQYQVSLNNVFVEQNNKGEYKLSVKTNNDINEPLFKSYSGLTKNSIKDAGEIIYEMKIPNKSRSIIFLFSYYFYQANKSQFVELFNYYLNLSKNLFNEKNFTASEKFLFFYEHLLKNKSDENIYNYLIEDFLEEIKKEKIAKIDIKVLISILIHSNKNQIFTDFICEKIRKREVDIDCEILQNKIINSNNNYYFEKIKSYLNSLDDFFKCYEVIELIIIYFIKFNKKEIGEILFNESNKLWKNLTKDSLKRQDNIIIHDNLFDKEIAEILLNKCCSVEEIKLILEQEKRCNFLLGEINDNFDKIYDIFMKEKFKGALEFEVDVNYFKLNDFSVFNTLYGEIYKKEKEKNKFFVNFNKILKILINFYKDKDDIDILFKLNELALKEVNNFQNSKILVNFYKEANFNLKKILIEQLKGNKIDYKKLLETLDLIYNHLKIGDKVFKFELKEIIEIFNFIYNKFLNDDDLDELIKQYQQTNLIHLFKGNENSIISQINWNDLKQFKNLAIFFILPQDNYSQDYTLKIYDIFKDIFRNNVNDAVKYKYVLNIIFRICAKEPKKVLKQFMEELEKRFTPKQYVDIFSYFVKANKDILDKDVLLIIFSSLNTIIDFKQDDHDYDYFDYDEYGIKVGSKIITIFDEIENQKLKSTALDILKEYVISEKDVFLDHKSNKFKLLENAIINKFYLSSLYKKEVNKVLSSIVKNIKEEKYKYNQLIIIYKNKDKMDEYTINNKKIKEKYYHIIKEHLPDISEEELKVQMNDIGRIESNINILKKMKEYYSFYILDSNEREEKIVKVEEKINSLENNPLNEISKYKDLPDILKPYYDEKFVEKLNYTESICYQNIFRIKTETNKKILNDLINDSINEFKDISKKILNRNIPEELKNKIINNYFENINKKEDIKKEIQILIKLNNGTKNEDLKESNNLKTNNDFEEIVEYIFLLKYEPSVNCILNGMKIFIENLSIEKTDLYERFKELFKDCSNKEKIQFLKNNEIINDIYELDKKNDHHSLINFFNFSTKIKNPFSWINRTEEKKLFLIIKYLYESDENTQLTSKDLKDLINVKLFCDQQKGKTDKLLIKAIVDKFKYEASKNNMFLNYMEKYNEITELYNIKISPNKNDIYIESIKNILNDSKIYIKYNKDVKQYQIDKAEILSSMPLCQTIDENVTKKFFSFQELIKMKEKSYLATSRINEIENGTFKVCKNFVEIFNNIDNFLYYLNMRNENQSELNIIISNNSAEIEIGNNNKILLVSKIKQYENLGQIIEKNYSEKKSLRFFYGQQFNILYDLIKSKNFEEIRNFVSCYFNNIIEDYNSEINIENSIHSNCKDNLVFFFEEKLKIISIYFDYIFNNNNKTYEDIYKRNLVKNYNLYENHKIYFCSFHKDLYENKLIDICLTLTNEWPYLTNIMFYSEETTTEELLIFLYRVFKCDLNSLFILLYKEDLSINKKNSIFLFATINKMVKKYKEERKSLLIVLYSDVNQKIIEYNKNEYPYYEKFEYKNNLKNKKTFKNKSIIISDICGAGKTKYIEDKFSYNYNYIYFPLGGYLSKENIITKLKNEIKLDNDKKNIIHIDLSDTLKYENLMREFLFKFLVFNFYGGDNELFYYDNKNTEIKIEIPNSYLNYLETYEILSYCNIEKNIIIHKEKSDLEILQLVEELKVKHIDENGKISTLNSLQIVSNLLLYIKNIKEGKKKILDNINLYSPEKIDPKDCDKLINDCLKENIKNLKHLDPYYPNYYQKINIVKWLSSEFIKFTECCYLDLSIYGNQIPKFFNDLRKNVLESTIINTIYLTFSPFDKIISNIDNTKYNIDRKENYDNLIRSLEKDRQDTVIDYDKINPSILIFHERDIGFSIITTDANDEKMFQISNYMNNYIEEFKKDKSDHNKKLITPLELENDGKLLDELLKIIGYKISESKKIKEFFNKNYFDYVFTRDNFVKMILLLMRIRAGIPTIIMGETGCGKTKLIQMFSILYTKNFINFKSLTFHAGITEKDVIKFLHKTIKEIDDEEEKILKDLMSEFNDDYKKDQEIKIKKKNTINQNLNLVQKYLLKSRIENENLDNMNAISKYLFEMLVGEENFVQKGYKAFDIKKVKESYKSKIKNEKIIIFFDEVNTSECLGFVKQIMLEKKYRKKYNISDRFIIICACNPYRLMSEKNRKINFGLQMKNKQKKKLVYTVNPLPFSLLNYVFDFKDLTDETTIKYIKDILKHLTKSEFITENYFDLTLELVKTSHKYIKEKRDISSVSLRDVNRFLKLYYFFVDYLKNKRNINKEIGLSSIILSLYICYYLRLPTKSFKKEYEKKINEILLNNNCKFLDIPNNEINFITDQILEGKIGYAKNRGLKENLFCEFVCLVNKENLIVVGKPGTSKSLSMQLLFDSMQGEHSKNNFFKSYKRIVPSLYQCSLTSTSEEIKKVFERAENKLKDNNYNIYSYVFMEEMGIADDSINNPLKVVHFKLDENKQKKDEEKISLIGLSNWNLDSSKMNRAICIVVEDPDEEYIKETALEIAKAKNKKKAEKYIDIINAISLTYYDYIMKYSDNVKDFHGFRDFYYLIKYIFSNINDNLEQDQNIIYVLKGIERNFGGYEKNINYIISSVEKENTIVEAMKEIFLEYYKKERIDKYSDKLMKEQIIMKIENVKKLSNSYKYNVINFINENLSEEIDTRYLLLVTKTKLDEDLLLNCLEGKNYIIYNGDDIFKNNNYDKNYNENNTILNLLLKIQIQINEDIILVFKNLEILYPSLYELFNKNYSDYGNHRKFTKISYENIKHFSSVSEKLKIIVLVDYEKLEEEDKPFLNRFEKHILSFDNIFDQFSKNKSIENSFDNPKKVIENIFNSINNLFNITVYNLNLRHHFINGNLENIKSLLVKCINFIKNNSLNIDEILNNIVPLFTQEMISLLNFNEFLINGISKNSIIFEKYNNYYSKNNNLSSFLKNIDKNDIKNVLYTFSNINNPLFANNFEIRCINKNIIFKEESTIIFNCNSNIFDNSFLEKMEKFMIENKNLFVIKFDEETGNQKVLLKIKKYIDEYTNYHKEKFQTKTKIILIIIYRQRINKNHNKNELNIINAKSSDGINYENNNYNINDKECVFSYLSSYNQNFIDNLQLNNKNNNDVVILNNIKKSKFISDKNEIDKIITRVIDKMPFNFKNEGGFITQNKQIIKNYLKNNEKILKIIQNKINRLFIDKNKSCLINILNGEIKINDNSDLISVFAEEQKKIIFDLLYGLFNYLECEHQIFDELIKKNNENKIIEEKLINALSQQTENKQYKGIKYIYSGFNYPSLIKKFDEIYSEIKSRMSEESFENSYLNGDDDEKKNYENKLKEKLILPNKELRDILINDSSQSVLLYEDFRQYFIFIILNIKNMNRGKIFEFLDTIIQLSINLEITDKNYFEKILNKGNNRDIPQYFIKMSIFLIYNENILKEIIDCFSDFINIPDIIKDFINSFIKNVKEENILKNIFEAFLDVILKIIFDSLDNKEKYKNNLNKLTNRIFSLSKINDEYKLNSISIKNIELILFAFKHTKNFEISTDNISDLEKEKYILTRRIEYDDFELKNIIKKIINIFNNDEKQLIPFIIQYNKYKYDDLLKSKLVEVILDDDNLLKNTDCFVKYILLDLLLNKWYLLGGENIKEDFDLCKYNYENLVIKTINKKLTENEEKNKNFLSEIILFQFESYYENYFIWIEDNNNLENDISKRNNNILFNKNFKLFKKTFSFYKDNFTITNIQVLNAIGYMKIYLKYYINIIYSTKNNSDSFEKNNKDESDDYFSREHESETKNNICYYMTKLLCRKTEKDYKDVIKDLRLSFLNNPNIDKKIKEGKIVKFFTLSSIYPNKNNLKEKLRTYNENLYLLKSVLNNKKSYSEISEKLTKTISLNKLSNLFMEYFNYTIQENKFSSMTLGNEINNKDFIYFLHKNNINNLKELIKEFIKNINTLNGKTIIDLNDYENTSLELFFPVKIKKENNKDKQSNLYDIYIDALKTQNEFIDNILRYIKVNIHELHYENLNKAIYIQEANESNIIKSFDENMLTEIILIYYSKKYLFDANNNVIYKNEDYNNEIDFYFEEIERNLGNIILTGIRKFISEKDNGIKKFKFYTDNIEIEEEIIYDYIKTYSFKNLSEKEKNYLSEKIKEKNKNDLFKLAKNLFTLMGSILSKIPKLEAKDIISDKIEIINGKNDLAELFKKEGSECENECGNPYLEQEEEEDYQFTVEHLVCIYNFIKEKYEHIK